MLQHTSNYMPKIKFLHYTSVTVNCQGSYSPSVKKHGKKARKTGHQILKKPPSISS